MNRHVVLADSLYAELVAQADEHKPKETGGILLGWADESSVNVGYALGPGPKALHELTSFTPDRDWQDERIAEIYDRHAGRIEYLGDWHTHPGGRAKPSRTDRALLRDTARNPACRCPRPMMIILGRPATQSVWTPMAHAYIPAAGPGRARVVPLPIVSS